MPPSVIANEHIQDAHRRGRVFVEVMPGDIVTAQARESAELLNIRLLDHPVEKPALVSTDGATAMRRVLYRRHPGWEPPRRQSVENARRISRLALIGAGGVGMNVAHLASNENIANEIALIDVLPGAAAATALDLQHARGATRSATQIVGDTSMKLAADAEVVVVSAGRPRTPGMSRADLRTINGRVIQSIGEQLSNLAPNCVVIVVSNPLDEMTHLMLQATGFPRERVIGMAGTLDSARFRNELAAVSGFPITDIDAVTLGSHGDEMVPIVSKAKIRERPLREFLNSRQIRECCERTISAGAAVVALRRSGSATLAPAHATMELIEHIRGAKVGSVPVSVMLNGEYGIQNVVLGVPCELGRSGVLRIVELALNDDELTGLRRAAQAVRTRLGA